MLGQGWTLCKGLRLYICKGGSAEGGRVKNSAGSQGGGFFTYGKTRVQIKKQNRGTDQFTKQGYRSRKSRKTRGTDQFFWRAKPGYRSVFLDLKWPPSPPQHRVYVRSQHMVMLHPNMRVMLHPNMRVMLGCLSPIFLLT